MKFEELSPGMRVTLRNGEYNYRVIVARHNLAVIEDERDGTRYLLDKPDGQISHMTALVA